MRKYDQCVRRTALYSNIYFQNAPFKWNLLAEEIRNSTSIEMFKRKLLAMIRPNGNSVYGINDTVGVKYLSQLRLKANFQSAELSERAEILLFAGENVALKLNR